MMIIHITAYTHNMILPYMFSSGYLPCLYLVCVAEKRRVCRSEGSSSRMQFIVSAKPMERHWSASSRTSICERVQEII